jgi:hypothetical protein
MKKRIITPERRAYMKEYLKEYRKTHKNETNKRDLERRNNDIVYRIRRNSASRIGSIFRNNGYSKQSRTHEILGCSFDDLIIYLESKFEPWMNWDNYGEGIYEPNKSWDVDHIMPLSSAKSEEELIKLCHYSNLQPLCSYYNRNIKKAKHVQL